MRNPSRTAALILLLSGLPLLAQWKTESYVLKGGWNAIYLHGDTTLPHPPFPRLLSTSVIPDEFNRVEAWRRSIFLK